MSIGRLGIEVRQPCEKRYRASAALRTPFNIPATVAFFTRTPVDRIRTVSVGVGAILKPPISIAGVLG